MDAWRVKPNSPSVTPSTEASEETKAPVLIDSSSATLGGRDMSPSKC